MGKERNNEKNSKKKIKEKPVAPSAAYYSSLN
jgi:hypothetical protein